MSFKDRNWHDRFAALGDEAEGIFEQVYTLAWDRYGLERPRTPMHGLVPFIRYTPDYITFHGPVEVQGFGRDQTIKIKRDKMEALEAWNAIQPTRLFLWDTTNNRWTIGPITDLTRFHPGWNAPAIRQFPEGKKYYAFDASLPVFDNWGWNPYDPPEDPPDDAA